MMRHSLRRWLRPHVRWVMSLSQIIGDSVLCLPLSMPTCMYHILFAFRHVIVFLWNVGCSWVMHVSCVSVWLCSVKSLWATVVHAQYTACMRTKLVVLTRRCLLDVNYCLVGVWWNQVDERTRPPWMIVWSASQHPRYWMRVKLGERRQSSFVLLGCHYALDSWTSCLGASLCIFCNLYDTSIEVLKIAWLICRRYSVLRRPGWTSVLSMYGLPSVVCFLHDVLQSAM